MTIPRKEGTAPMPVNKTLTQKRRRRDLEPPDYLAFARRVVRHLAKHAAADPEVLPDLLQLRRELDSTITHTIHQLRAQDFSWQYIADIVGLTKQACQQRWKTPE